MSVNPEGIRNNLEEHVRRGRSAVEAAGEVRWLVESFQISGVTSQGTVDGAIDVIDSWLAEKMGVPGEEVGIYSTVAAAYARFLAERVDVQTVTSHPVVQIDMAWDEWRKQGRT